MNHVRIKLAIALLILLGAVVLLARAATSGGYVYMMPVDEFVASEAAQTKRVRLNGVVCEENVDVSGALGVANFDLLGDTGRLPVSYTGVVPDMFKPGNEVIVEGKLDIEGTFQADTLMTKCASKYVASEETDQPADHPMHLPDDPPTEPPG
ncbi:MAG: cytochrome c maturation protein CcmE [Phycisphaerales bacterium JB038]